MAQRYDIEKSPDGRWMVIDRFTGWPAEEQGMLLVGLLMEEADDLLDLLNDRDIRDTTGQGDRLGGTTSVLPSGPCHDEQAGPAPPGQLRRGCRRGTPQVAQAGTQVEEGGRGLCGQR